MKKILNSKNGLESYDRSICIIIAGKEGNDRNMKISRVLISFFFPRLIFYEFITKSWKGEGGENK